MHTIYIYVYKSFFTTLDKGLKKYQKKRRDGEIVKHKLNEMGPLNMKQRKRNKLVKSKRSLYSPVVFKHGCLLQTYLELWRKKVFVFFKIFQHNSDMPLDFKK